MSGIEAARRGVRRYENGSIDIDFNRTLVAALRRQGMRDGATLKKCGAGLLAMAGILIVPLLFAGLPPAPQGPVAVVQSGTTSTVR